MTAMDYRQYDNALGRFNSVDALAELMPGITPYHFDFNNPVYWSDPTGLAPGDPDEPIELDEVQIVGKPKNSDRSYSAGLEMFELPKLEVGDFPEFSSGGGKDNLGEPKKKQVDPQSPEEQRKYQQDIKNLNDTWSPIIEFIIDWRTIIGSPVKGPKGLKVRPRVKIPKVKVEEAATVSFKSFTALKRALGAAGKGKAWHHIVEQTPGNIEKFGPEAIHNTGNVIILEHGAGTIHAKISGYYSSIDFFTGGQTVRKWLSTQSYQAQYEFGIQTLKRIQGTP